MTKPYKLLTKRALLGLGTSLMVATSTIGVTAINFAPSAFAATQASTQFTYLVNDLNNLYSNLSSSSVSSLESYASTVYGSASSVSSNSTNLSTWENILYSGTTGANLSSTSKATNVEQLAPLLGFMITSFLSGPISTSNITTLEQNFKTQFNDASGLTITGTDLYNFYENFLTNALTQYVLGSNPSLTSIVENALVYASSNTTSGGTSPFVGLLNTFGLEATDIPTIIANFEAAFPQTINAIDTVSQGFLIPKVSIAGGSAQTISNDALSTSAGQTLVFSFAPQNIGSTLSSMITSVPSSWITLTATGANANLVTISGTTVTENANITGTQSVTITPTLRGKYQLSPITLTINGSSTSTGGGTPTPSSGTGGGTTSPTTPAPTSPTATVTGTPGQTLTTAVLGNNGNQIQVSVPSGDVNLPIQVQLSALTSLPTTVAPISGVVQAISLDAQTTPSGTTTSGTTTSGTAVHYFDHPVTITFTLSSAPTAPISIVFWNALTKSWQPISNFSLNQSTVTMTTTHFTTFAVVNTSSVSSVNRIEGQRAIDTAIQAAQSAYPDGATSVVLAFAGTKMPSPDALSAAGLAGSLHAPILLTEQNQLDPAVLQSIQALGAKTVYVLGGKGAISDNVVNALTQAGLSVVRDFQGKTLYDTSLLIDQYMVQNKLTNASTVFIANGQTMIDALSASPVAYQQGAPMMLVQTGQKQLTAAQLAFLQSANIKNAVVLGGSYVVSPAIQNQLTQSLGATNVTRLGGKTMNDTAVAIDQNYFPNATGAVISSNGTPTGSFVDALSASAFAANNNVPILLTNQNGLPNSTSQYLSGQKSLHAIWVMGGSQAVVPGVNQTLSADIQSTN